MESISEKYVIGKQYKLKSIFELGFTRLGYEFKGWLSSDSGDLIEDGSTLAFTQETADLTATWKEFIPEDMLTFTAVGEPSTIKLDKNGTPYAVSLEYRVDDGEWNAFIPGSTTINLNAEQKAYLRSTVEDPDGTINKFSKDNGNYYQFAMTGKIAASGSIQYLLDKTGKRENVHAYCYRSMFYGCTSLMAAPQLPATQLANWCYAYMFYDCFYLTTASELPATQLADSCYRNMFAYCSNLSAAPHLPATQLANWCYAYMFSHCSKLITAPQLPASTLADSCYRYMFYACTSLSAAPQLPASTLADNCYLSMFQGCNKLSSIVVNFTAWNPSTATTAWVSNVASLGTFTCPVSLPQTRGTSSIPASWTIVTK